MLRRPALQRLIAIRTGHGDFAWHHVKFAHADANLRCSCGMAKAPDHLVRCRKARAAANKRPVTGRDVNERNSKARGELENLMRNPQKFQELLENTAFYRSICPQ